MTQAAVVLHPSEDPAFLNRRRPNAAVPANDPEYLFRLADIMEDDEVVRDTVWECFTAGDLDFMFHDVQLEMLDMVLTRPERELLIFSTRQLGKSFFILCVAIMHCAKYQGRRKPLVRIFCKTLKQVEEIVSDNMMIIEMLAPPGFIKRTKSEKRWKVGRGEIRVAPMAAAHVDGRRGGNATLVILEEGGFILSEQYQKAIGSVINPQLLRSGGKLVHVTTPSEDLGHYIHTTVLPRCELTGAVARYTVYDNVQLHDQQIIDAFERCTTTEEWLREYLVKIIKSALTTVIPEFDDMRHMVAMRRPEYAYWQTVLDFGGTLDKHGLLLVFWDFERAKLCVWEESLEEINTPTKKLVEKGEGMEEEHKVVWLDKRKRRIADSQGQTTIDLWSYGFSCTNPDKAPGSWEAGINQVRLALQRDEIEIHPRCVKLKATLNFGQYTSSRKDWQRTPELGHLDLLACLIYAWRARIRENPFPALPRGYSSSTHYVREEVLDNHNKHALAKRLEEFSNLG